MKLNDWVRITDNISQELFIKCQKIISEENTVIYDSEIYNFGGFYLKDCKIEIWESKVNEFLYTRMVIIVLPVHDIFIQKNIKM